MASIVILSLLACLIGVAVATTNVPGRNLIVVSLPEIKNQYYKDFYGKIVDFLIKYENNVEHENFLILADKEGIKNIRNRVDKGRFLYAPIYDIWMRDMTSAGRKPGGRTLFGYAPKYIEESLRPKIRNSFLKAMAFHGVDKPFDSETATIVDGGNIVDNGIEYAIATDRIFVDNKVTTDQAGQQKIRDEIKSLLKIENDLVVMKEFPGDTTGHSDGIVSFIDDYSLAISGMGLLQKELDDPKCWGDKGCEQVKSIIKEIKTAFAGTKVNAFSVPSKYAPKKWRNFTGACGAHVNTLVNDKYAYMPLFHDENAEDVTYKKTHTKELDEAVFDIFKKNTKKTIIPITVPNVICRMGGNLRCLSWQVDGEIADKLVAAASKAAETYYDDAALDKLEERYCDFSKMCK